MSVPIQIVDLSVEECFCNFDVGGKIYFTDKPLDEL